MLIPTLTGLVRKTRMPLLGDGFSQFLSIIEYHCGVTAATHSVKGPRSSEITRASRGRAEAALSARRRTKAVSKAI